MSKNEVYDLLEIHQPENDFKSINGSQNMAKHLLIRVFSVILIIGAILIYTELENFGSNDTLGIWLGCALIFIIWFFFLVIEAIVLQVRKKHLLRNVNLILIGFVLLLITLFIGTNL